ncbi:MAG: hypothetical protein AAF403_00565, partial [Pseudomonadota bacterium]
IKRHTGPPLECNEQCSRRKPSSSREMLAGRSNRFWKRSKLFVCRRNKNRRLSTVLICHSYHIRAGTQSPKPTDTTLIKKCATYAQITYFVIIIRQIHPTFKPII